MQRISCDQCRNPLFYSLLLSLSLAGANVLSSGSQWTHLLTSNCVFFVCLCFFARVCGALYGAKWLTVGEKGGRQVAAENGTKLAGDNKLVAERKQQSGFLKKRSNKRNKIRWFGMTQSP